MFLLKVFCYKTSFSNCGGLVCRLLFPCILVYQNVSERRRTHTVFHLALVSLVFVHVMVRDVWSLDHSH